MEQTNRGKFQMFPLRFPAQLVGAGTQDRFGEQRLYFLPERGSVSWSVYTWGGASVKQMFRKHFLKWRVLDISSQDNFMCKKASCTTGHPPTYTFTHVCRPLSQWQAGGMGISSLYLWRKSG